MIESMSVNEAHPDILELLACPRCRQPIKEDAQSQSWNCQTCGRVGQSTLGFPDFITEQTVLEAAAGGTFDLEADEACAVELAKRADELSFVELRALSVELQSGEVQELSPVERRAQERFAKSYAEMEAQISVGSGQAFFTKLNPFLVEKGRPPVSGRWALEAGGGHGLFLPDFSGIFGAVVFLDCSLVHVVLARKLAEESGAKNVFFVRGDAHALPFRSGAFNFVHEDGVVEHVAYPERMVKEGLRVTASDGTYVVLSPNRFSVAREPHFRLPGFGFFPRPVRRHLIYWLRGISSEAGTDPRSLRQLRGYFESAGEKNVHVFFLPRGLELTARNTPLRRMVRAALASPRVGALVSGIINGPLLWLMPYHIAVVSRDG